MNVIFLNNVYLYNQFLKWTFKFDWIRLVFQIGDRRDDAHLTVKLHQTQKLTPIGFDKRYFLYTGFRVVVFLFTISRIRNRI